MEITRESLKIWRESASLILAAKSNFCQTSDYNYKLLSLQRSAKSKVYSNTYVFPGGNTSETDGSASWVKVFEKFGYKLDSFKSLCPVENVPSILQNGTPGCLPKYLSLRICAIRETFEECGILICKSSHCKKNPTNWASYIGGYETIKWQNKVHDDPDEFLNLCKQLDVYPDVWALKDWSNWMTPTDVPVRFNTMFFFASFNQVPSIHLEEKEIQNTKWATPDKYLEENLNKSIQLPIPQYYEISRLRNFIDINSLLTYANNRSPYGCEKYFPYRIRTNEGLYTLFPGDELYPEHINKDNTKVPELDGLPQSRIQNRLLLEGQYVVKLFIQNFLPKDRHLSPKV